MSEEYITKNQALTMIMAVIEGDESEEVLDALQRASDNITTLPCADVSPVVHGYWKKHPHSDDKYEFYTCCCCRRNMFPTNDYRFCPDCGAKMDKEKQHEEKTNA